MATEKELRKSLAKTAKKFVGAKQGSKKHHEIVDVFNTVKPSGEVMNYYAPWCAASVTAWAIMTFGKKDAEKAFPLDYNCGRLIEKAKALGGWKESDAYKPRCGDLIVFNWDAAATGETRSGADHVGVVEHVIDGLITTIEGNFSSVSQVGRRTFPIDWRYTRGVIVPRYEKIVDLSEKNTESVKTSTSTKKATESCKDVQGTYYRVNTKDGLNVRKGPGLAYKIITAIPNGTKVAITKTSGGWGYSKTLGGWLYMAYLKKA